MALRFGMNVPAEFKVLLNSLRRVVLVTTIKKYVEQP
jgi:hypothetical protein